MLALNDKQRMDGLQLLLTRMDADGADEDAADMLFTYLWLESVGDVRVDIERLLTEKLTREERMEII